MAARIRRSAWFSTVIILVVLAVTFADATQSATPPSMTVSVEPTRNGDSLSGFQVFVLTTAAPSGGIQLVLNGVNCGKMTQNTANPKLFEHTVAWATAAPSTYVFEAQALADNGEILSAASSVYRDDPSRKTLPLGIAVGRAKYFDVRTLQRMLRDVEESLATAQFINTAAAVSALGRMQGSTASTQWFQANITGPGAPATNATTSSTSNVSSGSTVTQTSTGTAGTTTTTATSTAPSQTSTATTSQTTTIPGLTASTAGPPSGNPAITYTAQNYGYSAQDVLGEQTELAFQAFNLRLLLQGALSDQFASYSTNPSEGFDYRSQPVLGFQVSLDPPKGFHDAVAEVIITIATSPNSLTAQDPPSIVALLPRDKTYNVAAIRRGSSALSLGAVAMPIALGIGGGRSSESVYLVKDTDTLALEHVAPEELQGKAARSIQFGWQFRPVLGQRSVSPGTRQVFAVLSLPATEREKWSGLVQVVTRWRAFDRKKKTAGLVLKESTSSQQPYVVEIPAVDAQNRAVAARIASVEWHDAGSGRAVATVSGHMPPGTLISLGDSIIDTGNGLIMRTPRRIAFVAPVQKLALGDAHLVDPFGIETPILYGEARNRPGEPGLHEGLKIKNAIATPSGATTKVNVTLTSLKGEYPEALDASDHRVLLIVGGKVFGLSEALPTIGKTQTSFFDRIIRGTSEDKKSAILECTVPTQNFLDLPVVQVVDPFWGSRYRDEAAIEGDKNLPPLVTGMKLISEEKDYVLFAIEGSRFKTANLKLVVGTKEILKGTEKREGYKILSDTLLIFPLTDTDLATVRHVVVVDQGSLLGNPSSSGALTLNRRPIADPVLLAIPELRFPKPKIIAQESVVQGSPTPVRFDGVNFLYIQSIHYAGKPLDFKIDAADSSVMYLTPEAAVREAGEKELQIFSRSGELVTYRLRVDPKK